MTPVIFTVTYAALFLGGIILPLWWRHRRRGERAPFPENTRLLRGPGESLRRTLDQLDDKFADLFFRGLLIPLLALSGILALATRLKGWTGLVCASAGFLAFVFLSVFHARQLIRLVTRRRNTRLGFFGERIVAEHLEPLKCAGYRVFHDVPAGDPQTGSTTSPYNIDHVVVGPSGVFAVETKTRRKGRARVGFMAHEIIYDGRALAYPWGEDQHGLEQARRQADWLADFLQRQLGRAIPVQPLLVFPGWMIIRKGPGAVNVLNPKELPSAIEAGVSTEPGQRAPRLDETAIDLIARQLDSRCRDVEL